MLTDGQARRIASDWHGGQWSALYSLSSCGAIDLAAVTAEIAGALVESASADEPAQEEHNLFALSDYVGAKGNRQPVEGWSSLWDDTPVVR